MTTAGRLIGTLAYMSPEQVRGDSAAIDPRSDVYALGVILYELLSGRLPYRAPRDAWHPLAQEILEGEPLALGAVNRALRGDIEIIVAKALEKEPGQRYNSAADLAADIRRHLRDHAINARRSTLVYRFRKFTKRNVVGVVSASALIIMFVSFWRDARTGTTQVVLRSAASLELRGITPAPNSRVSTDTVIVADLTFSVDRFEKGQFRIEPHIVTSTNSAITLADHSNLIESPVLQEARGNVRVRLPMRAVFDDTRVKPPFAIEFSLMQMCGTIGFCTAVAVTGPVQYVAGDSDTRSTIKGRPGSAPR
jgi:serine/threonine protein kinase